MLNTDDIESITKLILTHICKDWKKVKMILPYSQNLYALQKMAFIQETKENEEGYELTLLANERVINLYSKFIVD